MDDAVEYTQAYEPGATVRYPYDDTPTTYTSIYHKPPETDVEKLPGEDKPEEQKQTDQVTTKVVTAPAATAPTEPKHAETK